MAITNKPRWPFRIPVLVLVYLLVADVLAPHLWKHHESKDPDLRDGPTLTR
jgi:hypothetical protein